MSLAVSDEYDISMLTYLIALECIFRVFDGDMSSTREEAYYKYRER